jgi:hypothetical protein
MGSSTGLIHVIHGSVMWISTIFDGHEQTSQIAAKKSQRQLSSSSL